MLYQGWPPLVQRGGTIVKYLEGPSSKSKIYRLIFVETRTVDRANHARI